VPPGQTLAPEIVTPAEAPAALVLEHGFTATIAARVAVAAGALAPVVLAAAPTRARAPRLEESGRGSSARQLRTTRPLSAAPAAGGSQLTRPHQAGAPAVLPAGIAGLAAAAAGAAALFLRRRRTTLPSPPRLHVVPQAEPEHRQERLAA
jgi:hypothetical protein